MNHRRWANITAAREAYESAFESASPSPIEAFIEVAARCNLHCQMCAINYDSRYQARSGRPPFFEPDLFARLRPLFPSLVRAYLFGLGEPTLNKHLVDYIQALSDAGVEVWFNTNATLIDERKADEIARAGATKITVSIDGATAGTYETIRRGAKFAAVMHGIRALVAAEKKYGRPKVNLSFVAMASNIGELPAMVDLCADLGATGVHVEPLFAQPGSAELMEHYWRENLGVSDAKCVSDLFDDAFRRAEFRGVSLATRFAGARDEFDYLRRAKNERADWTCSEPWSSIWVTSAGEVRTCCVNETSFGNLFERTIEEIWNGEAFHHFRAQHARRDDPTGCRNCIANGRIRQSPFFRAIMPVTYRPLFEALPIAGSTDVVKIDAPHAGSTVTDPLVVTGSMDRAIPPEDLELMIDSTPVANFNESGYFAGRQFVIEVPIDFVSEGAHVVWAHRRDQKEGWGHRQVFLWRADSERPRTTTQAVFAIPRRKAPWAPTLSIGGFEWQRVAWKTMRNVRGMNMVGVADLTSLPPGDYTGQIRFLGRIVSERPFKRLQTD